MGADATKPKMKIEGLVREHKLAPHQMTERLTPEPDLFVLAHLGIPEIDIAAWQLVVDGLVDNPLTLDFDSLTKRPRKVVETIHQCAGSPMNPTVPTRQIANVEWAGASLRDLLEEAGIDEGASHVWAYGSDHGNFAGDDQDHYLKDLPVSRLAEGDVLIAYELNGEPLSKKHGFPARLVIPGYFGTNCVKWLSRLHIADRRASSTFTTRFYNDPQPDSDETTPVWEILPESVIVAPAPESRLETSETEIWGWAWSAHEVATVEVSTDDGQSWQPAILEPRRQRAWQKFACSWTPQDSGGYRLMSRATDTQGRRQPLDGARNAVHAVAVEVGD
jgi:sulfane dehydrogenase subunit SoxC